MVKNAVQMLFGKENCIQNVARFSTGYGKVWVDNYELQMTKTDD